MRALVVFYSRSGNTRLVAHRLAQLLGCDVDEIQTRTLRSGVFGYLRCLAEALAKHPAAILPSRVRPDDYDLVIVGTPVWASSSSSPVRAYLKAHRDQIHKVALFCTLGGAGEGKAFREMERTLRRSAVGHCAIFEREIRSGECARSIDEFAQSLNPEAATRVATLNPLAAE